MTSTGFKYGYEPDLSDGIEVAGDTITGDFSADLTGLVTNDSIYFTAFATNALGTTYGDTLVFKVAPDACNSESTLNYQGQDYGLVVIENDCWFARNLSATNYRDGSSITLIEDDASWQITADGAWCYPDGDSQSPIEWGALYNWHTVDDERGLCPSGWHVPTATEWYNLRDNVLGGFAVAGELLKSSDSDTPAWDGVNSFGFSALPAGRRGNDSGLFFSYAGTEAAFLDLLF